MTALDPQSSVGAELGASLEQLLDEIARRAARQAVEQADVDRDRAVLGVEEAAELLGVDRDVVERELRAGVLPGRKVGRRWRLPRRALLDHLENGGGT